MGYYKGNKEKMENDILKGLIKQHKKPVDNIPARLTENEYVIPADILVLVGKGNPKKGADFFSNMIDELRKKAKGKLKKHISVRDKIAK